MPKVKKCHFQSEWLTNEKYSAWIQSILSDRSKARCSFCKTEFDDSNMGVSAVDSHTTGKKHTQFASATTSSAIFFSGELVFIFIFVVVVVVDHFRPLSSHKELCLC